MYKYELIRPVKLNELVSRAIGNPVLKVSRSTIDQPIMQEPILGLTKSRLSVHRIMQLSGQLTRIHISVIEWLTSMLKKKSVVN